LVAAFGHIGLPGLTRDQGVGQRQGHRAAQTSNMSQTSTACDGATEDSAMKGANENQQKACYQSAGGGRNQQQLDSAAGPGGRGETSKGQCSL
jgi:hypothetical protein